jgi:hypothetical protein
MDSERARDVEGLKTFCAREDQDVLLSFIDGVNDGSLLVMDGFQ